MTVSLLLFGERRESVSSFASPPADTDDEYVSESRVSPNARSMSSSSYLSVIIAPCAEDEDFAVTGGPWSSLLSSEAEPVAESVSLFVVPTE